MKSLTSVFVAIVCALLAGGCAAPKQWTVPSNLHQGDAKTIVANAAQAGALDQLLEAAQTTVFDVDEERMAELLREALATGKLSETQKSTAEWMLHDVCEVNARDSIAADFRFATPEASENRLHTFAPGEPLLLLFYNPDCSHCRQVIDQLRKMQNLPRVLAVCIETPAKRWESTRSDLPNNWVAAFDRSGVIENDIYSIRSMPSIYLLDADRRVVLKNPPVKKLSERFDSK